jgi:hypothetical protein
MGLEPGVTHWDILDKVDTFFNDMDKSREWYCTKNPLLGGFSPDEMVKAGRGWKLMKFIKIRMDENKRETT